MSDPTRFGITDDNVLDKTTTRIKEELDRLHDLYVRTEEDEKQWQKWLNNSRDDIEGLDEAIQEFTKKTLKDYATSLIGGTDVGNFADKMDKGADWKTALFEVFMDDLVKVIGGFDKLQFILNIVNNLIEAFSPVLEAVLNVVGLIGWILKPIFDALNKLFTWIFGDFNDACDKLYNSMDEEAEKRKENTKDMTNQYKALMEAIREQEEYYIRKKAELNMFALDEKVTKVNDMILSPNGAFSTSPQDTIIATKNPQGLGGVTNNIKVINNAGAEVNVSERKGNGINDIIVTISKKIASDVANGYNGWDGAFAMQQQRVNGRRI